MALSAVSVYLATDYREGDSGALAVRCAERHLERRGQPGALVRLRHDLTGRPFVEGAELHISISHTGAVWACALSASPVGIDLEHRRDKDYSAIARRHFHPEDAARTDGHDEIFYRLWTARESVIKLTGNTEGKRIRAYRLLPTPTLNGADAGLYLQWHTPLPEHTLCLCTRDESPQAVFFPAPAL